jgi:MFS transporter, FHS family, L-fucose permease
MQQRSSSLLPFIIITTLFFLWGFITVFVDALIPRLKAVFELNYFQAGLVQMAFFGAYLLVSLPASRLVLSIGYKKGVIVGLLIMAIGCCMFHPAADFRLYWIFLSALFVLAAGITILQVAANPYVVTLGPPESGSSRLSLSQAFNSLGTTIAPIFSATFILGTSVMTSEQIAVLDSVSMTEYYRAEAEAVKLPFLAIALFIGLVAIAFSLFKLPEPNQDKEPDFHWDWRSILSDRNLMFGALGIFLYVGAEVAIGSYLVNYFLIQNIGEMTSQHPWMGSIVSNLSGGELEDMNVERIAGTLVFFYWGSAMIGRFFGSVLLKFFKPGRVLSLYALIAIVLISTSILTQGPVSVTSILFVGFLNSIMFPTIFALAIEGMGKNTPIGSGILCMSIFGGAIIPPLFGVTADTFGIHLAFIVPILCYFYISGYGVYKSRLHR